MPRNGKPRSSAEPRTMIRYKCAALNAASSDSVIMQSSDLKGFRFHLNACNSVVRRLFPTLFAALLLLTAAAHAQFRSIPTDAKRATVGAQQLPLPYIDLGGKS